MGSIPCLEGFTADPSRTAGSASPETSTSTHVAALLRTPPAPAKSEEVMKRRRLGLVDLIVLSMVALLTFLAWYFDPHLAREAGGQVVRLGLRIG